MGIDLKVRFAANPPTVAGWPGTAFNPTANSNPLLATWVNWPDVEMVSQVTIAPTRLLATLGLTKDNLFE